jgi:hypothetical protein
MIIYVRSPFAPPRLGDRLYTFLFLEYTTSIAFILHLKDYHWTEGILKHPTSLLFCISTQIPHTTQRKQRPVTGGCGLVLGTEGAIRQPIPADDRL